MSSRESTRKTLLVAFCLCVACSIVVSSTAVILKPYQDENRLLDRNKNILTAAGMFDADVDGNDVVAERFAEFTTRVIDLETGEWLDDAALQELEIDLSTYDQRAVINDPRYSEPVPADEDTANIKRRVNYPLVYVREENGTIDTIVLPVNGYGLWGIMYGFLALEGDANTVRGLAFYELKETPGLGAEVRNPRWMALWPGKRVYNDNGEVGLRVVKGPGSGDFQVDGLSGATLTTRGVDNLIQYWLGDTGYGPALDQLQELN
ncbi:MAG: Na(+)-translocating NADH-quinone reductase subunit C [Proteobacteria bacterium]|nr:Na(+)-translocating NADH-quinone reductase subunit C [Pseudomonadota bacterium]MDA0928946.1 Na(+)-translocating NADH-quinone reductase subunit C [Pseudomonadota bacterium]